MSLLPWAALHSGSEQLGMNLLLIVYLPLQEQIKHAIQNALFIFCKLQISRLCVYERQPPPSIFKGILRCLNFLYIKFLKTNIVR
jgi:hypothetical protein